MSGYLYSFAAKEIQNFILFGGKLQEMVGASELVNQLCQDFLESCFSGLGIDKKKYSIITQAAGWARIRFDNLEDAHLFASYWPFLSNRFAPGIKVVQALVEVKNSFADAVIQSEKILRTERNVIWPDLPEIGPLINRNPRTGFAAVQHYKNEIIDRQSYRKRTAASNTSLVDKITTDKILKWPLDMDSIATPENSYIAVIHADGNGLGNILMNLSSHIREKNLPEDTSIEIFKCFSKAIEDINKTAVRKAFDTILKPDFERNEDDYLAARPIVLGGDDLTIIVRANLAFEFTRTYMECFEEESGIVLKEYLGCYSIPRLPKQITTCAGIALVKKAYPFSRAYELAESLCENSKKAARDVAGDTFIPSCFSFHRVSASISEDYCGIQKKELTAHYSSPIKFWFGPYMVGSHSGNLPKFIDLQALAAVLTEIPSGQIRELVQILYESKEEAKTKFMRILQILNRHNNSTKADDLKNRLVTLTDNADDVLWSNVNQTPLLDALRLRELTSKKSGGR